MTKRRAPPKRGKKGSIDAHRLIGFPEELLVSIDKVAAREGISAAEWVRRACAKALAVRP